MGLSGGLVPKKRVSVRLRPYLETALRVIIKASGVRPLEQWTPFIPHTLYMTSHIQVALPEAMLPRYEHTATVFGSGPDCRQLVLWGGRKEFLGDSIGQTTLLNFGEDECESTP